MNELLTVEKLKSLKYGLVMHLNGGSKWSGTVKSNKEFDLILNSRTNGRPEYKYTERTLSTADGEVVADLLSNDFEGELLRFVEAYNTKQRTAVT